MAKLKPIAFTVGIMLLIGAVLCLYFSLRNLSSIRPASAYEDMGVHTFVPEEVYPVQRENHATGRQKRNHPTTTVYIVRYRSEDGSGYQYEYESGSVESTAQNILKTGDPIERRGLSISGEDDYITSAQTKPRRHTKLGRSAPIGRLPEYLWPICWYGLRSMGCYSINGARECELIWFLAGNGKRYPP